MLNPKPRAPISVQRRPLEPLDIVAVAVVVIHLLLGLIIWTLLPLMPAASLKPVWESVRVDWLRKKPAYWFNPGDYTLHPELKSHSFAIESSSLSESDRTQDGAKTTTSSGASAPVAVTAETESAPPKETSSPAVMKLDATSTAKAEVPVKENAEAKPVALEADAKTRESALAASDVLPEEASLLAETSALKAPAGPPATRSASKIITLSPMLDGESIEKGISGDPQKRATVALLDVLRQEERKAKLEKASGGAPMDPVLEALESALKKAWDAPNVASVPPSQRLARLVVSIGRDGQIIEVKMAQPSGDSAMDQSVMDASTQVKKISESLPSSFPKDRYNVEVTFHIE